jgi:Holliday junction resolvase RusA-like endonuclease
VSDHELDDAGRMADPLTFELSVSRAQLLVRLAVDGDPVPWSRAGQGRLGQHYTPKRYGAWRDQVSWGMRQAYHGKPTLEALGVWAVFRRKTRRHVDLDNLCKAVLDAGTGIVWGDDAYVTLLLGRLIVEPDRPGLELIVYRREVDLDDEGSVSSAGL